MYARINGTASLSSETTTSRVAMPLAGDDNDLALGRGCGDRLDRPSVSLAWKIEERSKVNLGLRICEEEFAVEVNLGENRLAQLVQQQEGALRVDVHVEGHMERGDDFEEVAEQRDHGEVVADRQLVRMEQRDGRDGELAAAAGALPPDRRLGERVDLQGAAVRTKRLAVGGRERHQLEGVERRVVGHPHDAGEAQGAGGTR